MYFPFWAKGLKWCLAQEKMDQDESQVQPFPPSKPRAGKDNIEGSTWASPD